MNKQVNQDLKNLTNWLNANKICLNVSKTEVVLFKSSRKLTDVPLKLKLNGKIFYSTNSVKYLGINIDENLAIRELPSDFLTHLFFKTFCSVSFSTSISDYSERKFIS